MKSIPTFRIIRLNTRFYLEPIGSRVPTFPSDSKSSTFVRDEGSSFALLCQAQGFPTPLFRYSININV